jgi:hypothetical protein
MDVDDAELFQLEAAVRTLLPPVAVLQSIASSGSNGSSHTATGALQGDSALEKHTSRQGPIQLTAVAVTFGQ